LKFLVKKQFLFFAVLFTLVILRFFFIDGGATKALYDFDEARYAEVAKNILKTNNWWVQHAGGPDDVKGLYLWKPPLHPIVIALSYKLFGVNELGVRFPTLLFFLGNCVVLFFLAKHFFQKQKIVPYLATILFIFFPDNAFLYSQGIAEQQLLFFNLLALLFAVQKKQSFSIVGGLFWGLAILTKGFAAWWVPALLIIEYIKSKNKSDLYNALLFIFIGLVVALPWHIFMYSQFGKLFIDNYVLVNTIGRSLGAAANIAPFWWYGAWMTWSWRPLIFLIPFMISSFKFQNSRFPIWFLLILIPFSFVKSKVWWYIFPASIPLLLLSLDVIMTNPFSVLLSVVISMLPIWEMGALPIKWQMAFFVLYVFGIFFVNTKIKMNATKELKNSAIVGVIIISLLFSLKTSTQNSDKNKDLKMLFTRNKTFDLSTYKMPYEASLFYSNNATIKRDDLNSRYIITKREYANNVENNYWLIDREGEFMLMKKMR